MPACSGSTARGFWNGHLSGSQAPGCLRGSLTVAPGGRAAGRLRQGERIGGGSSGSGRVRRRSGVKSGENAAHAGDSAGSGSVSGTKGTGPVEPAALRAGVYVDIENLADLETAQRVVAAVVRRWPEHCPPIGRLSLYVPAEKAELWELWGEAEFQCLRRRVHGVQRFTRQASKNAADIAIAVDAICDYVTGDVAHVAVVSNDSDFAALFSKIRGLAAERRPSPFLWITVGNGSGISVDMARFVAGDMRWEIDEPAGPPAPKGKAGKSAAPKKAAASKRSRGKPAKPENEAIADRLVAELSGTFKAQQAMAVIKRHWPGHGAAQSTQRCGHFLASELWPFLKARGVKQVRQNSPRTYEIGKRVKSG